MKHFNQRPWGLRAHGFALVVTLSLMILLTVVAVGLLTLSSISIRGSSSHEAMNAARANARMGMMLAIGDLQKYAGPDQRVAFQSSLPTGTPTAEPSNPMWTGTVDVSQSNGTLSSKNSEIKWLVSGNAPDPAVALSISPGWSAGNALKLVTLKSQNGSNAPREVLAPVVAIQSKQRGRFAWWVTDESAKARVDIDAPVEIPANNAGKLALSQVPQEPGLVNLGDMWSSFGPESDIDKTSLISLPTTAIVAGTPDLPDQYFNDLTTGGFGIPTNVVNGGLKADLSLIFDRSQKFSETYLGARASSTGLNGAKVLTFSVNSAKDFYLSDTISKGGSVPAGPNWGSLWNYANLWQNVVNNETVLVGPNPLVESDVRFKNWLPNTNSDKGPYRRDLPHTNSPISPVVSLLQLGFRLSAEKVVKAKPADPDFYKAQITMQPVLGLWNPYNVKIKATPYKFDWALYPYFRFNYAKSDGKGGTVPNTGLLTTLWLRDEWVKGGLIPTPEEPLNSNYFMVQTPAVDLQPGEFRLFSVVDKSAASPGKRYQLKPGWSEKGGFTINLKDPAGNQRLVPSGYRAWFGGIVLLDTQSADTMARFPTIDPTAMASTWFTLKDAASDNILFRTTDIWNGDSKAKIKVPEPIVSGSPGVGTTKPTFLIDDLEGDKVLAHIATWSFISRTTLQAEENTQRLRGWVDANPRAMVANPVWDGSKVGSAGESHGWHTVSQLLGVYNPPGKPKQLGDGYGGNRGLLSEGGTSVYEPEVNKAGGRYQGFGGAATTSAGMNHVIVYDVPRSPLVSIGQFQHAQLSRYNFDPGFMVGNSYANPRVPLDSTSNPNFSGVSGLTITDTSHEVNKRLWDGFYFSTLGLDYAGTGQSSFDKAFDFKKLASGGASLPNPRMCFVPAKSDTSIDKIIKDTGTLAPEAISARIKIKGAFNVNSTSVTAWKAVLSSMGASQLPVINPATAATSWTNPEGIRFNRFGHVITGQSYEKTGGDDTGFWQGWRNLSPSELDALANEIVKEVKARGPFRSMAEFVNRDPAAASVEHQRKGALQAAIDRTVNAELPESIGGTATVPAGPHFAQAVSDENQAAGNASYLLQGDILQSLAPVLQVRSDYFKIRTCGESVNSAGKVVARAWCEAYVQRESDYVDPADENHITAAKLESDVNKTFGRRFQIVSFRWLNPGEV